MDADGAASSASRSKSGDNDAEKLQEILKEIFTLGGLFDLGGSSGGSERGPEDPSKLILDADEILGSEHPAEDMAEEIFRLPILITEDPMTSYPDLAAPVPEPTGALLFGLGILAVAGRRAHSERLR